MKVLVVGAGISGIRTAQLLEQAGIEVAVFEARDRVGGRLETINLPEGYVEAGGEWIDSDQQRAISLLTEFGLEPEGHEQFPGRVLYQGEEAVEDHVWPDAEADARAIHHEATELCHQISPEPWLQDHLADLDKRTLASWFDHLCISPRGRWWVEAVTRSDEGEDSSAVGLLGWLVGYKHYLERTSGEMSAFRFPGGAQSLVARMSETLQGDIFFDHILHSVEQNEESVQIWCKGEMAFGDRVVITLPPPVLRKIEFPFDFPDEKLKAWETIGSARAIKVTLRFKRRFWLDEKWQGRMLSNLPFQQIWDSGREGAACLSAYICGQAAVNIARQRDPVAGVLRAVSEVAPLAQEEFVEGWLHDWIHDPYSLGAFTSLTPGSVRDALPHLATPVGRIHFAGEYASSWQGFVEGALESAERVVEEVLESGR